MFIELPIYLLVLCFVFSIAQCKKKKKKASAELHCTLQRVGNSYYVSARCHYKDGQVTTNGTTRAATKSELQRIADYEAQWVSWKRLYDGYMAINYPSFFTSNTKDAPPPKQPKDAPKTPEFPCICCKKDKDCKKK